MQTAAQKSPDADQGIRAFLSFDRCSMQVAEEEAAPLIKSLELADRTESVGLDAQDAKVVGLGLPSRLNSRCSGSCTAKDIGDSAKGRKQTSVAQAAHDHLPFASGLIAGPLS
jgi:hypothetical protein